MSVRGLDDLVAAVMAAPEDLAVRRVFADALLEASDPRGDLAAAQCAIAASEPIDYYDDLCEAETAALEGCARTLQAEVPGVELATWCGFFDVLKLTVPQLERALAKGVFARHPVRRVELETPTQAMFARAGKLFEKLHATTVRELWIGKRAEHVYVPTSTKVVRLAIDRSPFVHWERAIEFSYVAASEAVWEKFAAATVATKLRVARCGLGVALLAALAKPGAAPRLQALGIELPHVDEEIDLSGEWWRAIGARLREVELVGFSGASCEQIVPALFAEANLEAFVGSIGDRGKTAELVVAQPRARSLAKFLVWMTPKTLMAALAAMPQLVEVEAAVWRDDFVDKPSMARLTKALRASRVTRVHCHQVDFSISKALRDRVFFGHQRDRRFVRQILL